MHNAYITSTVYAIRSKGSVSFCFNDYYNSPYFLSDRFERNPVHTSLSQCCSCCGFSSHKLPVNRCYFYGPRQSSLLQWSASRKLVFGGGDRYYCRYYNCSPNYGVEWSCCDISCCVNERIVCCNSRRRGKVRCCCVVGEEGDGGVCDSRRVDDGEALLSLLSEGVNEEGYCVGGGKRRNRCSFRRVAVKGKGDFRGRERNFDLYERVEARKRASGDLICECGKKKNGELRLGDGDRNHRFRAVIIESKDEGSGRNEKESEAISRGMNRRQRKDSSSCSSYYSLSSSGDFDGESEVHDKHTLLAEETLSSYERSRLKDEGRFDGQVIEKYEGYSNGMDEHSEQRNTVVANGIEWERKNKLSKKQSDRLVEEVQESGQKSSHSHTRVLGIQGSSHEQMLRSHQQVSEKEESSTLALNVDRRMRKQYAHSENQVGEASTSRRNFADSKETHDIHRDDMNTISQSRVRLDSRKENLEIEKDERLKAVSYRAEEENINRKTQIRRISEVQDSDTQRTSISQTHAELGVTGVEQYRQSVSSSRQGREQSHHETSQQANPRRNSDQAIRISEIHDSNIEKTSITRSQTSSSNQVNNTNLISISYQGSTQPHPHPQTDQRRPQRDKSGSDSYVGNDTMVVRSSETERVIDTQRTSETRVHQENEAVSVGTSVRKTREGNNRTDEMIQKIRPRMELEESSMAQEQLRLDLQARMQKDGADEGVRRSSRTTMTPPRSQSLSRSSLPLELESGFKSQGISSTTLEGGSSSSHVDSRRQPPTLQHDSYGINERVETHGEPLYLAAPEDALGSVERLQESSAHFVGEFVEKARHEASMSEIQRVEEVSETKLDSGDDKNRQKASNQHGAEDFQPKEQDKEFSSGGSGTKEGPSDEMWDVSGPSAFKTPRTEEPEATTATAENAVAKRSGRSLWNIIADIITLKWGSHSETPNSASRSGRRISSNESAASEMWFSTYESEQSKDKPASEKVPLRLENKSGQLQVTRSSTLAQGNESDRFADQTRDPEAEPSPPTTRIGSGSTSKRISLSGDENIAWNEGNGGKSSRASPSGIEIMESPSQRRIRGESATIISQVSDTTTNQSGLVEQVEQYEPPKMTEVPAAEGSSGGELKRRKLQRNKQVPKDRFDEWEEAFTHESEQRKLDEMFMREALVEAKKAADTWEVPVGAILVHNGTIIARGYNLVEELRDSTAHAEMICIREASNQLRSWRLADTTLYVTLEPCPMCAGAILQARISTLVWGAPNKLLGADGGWIRLFPDGGDGGNNSEASDKPAAPVHPFHPSMNIRRGVLATECAEVMQQFFQLRRKKKEKQAAAEDSPSSRLSISHHPSKFLKKMHDVFHVMFCL